MLLAILAFCATLCACALQLAFPLLMLVLALPLLECNFSGGHANQRARTITKARYGVVTFAQFAWLPEAIEEGRPERA